MKSNESLGKNQLPYYQNNTDMAPSLHVMIEKEDQWIQITSFHPFSWVLLRFESAQPQPVCHPHHPGPPAGSPTVLESEQFPCPVADSNRQQENSAPPGLIFRMFAWPLPRSWERNLGFDHKISPNSASTGRRTSGGD